MNEKEITSFTDLMGLRLKQGARKGKYRQDQRLSPNSKLPLHTTQEERAQASTRDLGASERHL